VTRSAAPPWPSRDLATLARALDTFVPAPEADAARQAALAVATLRAVADPSEVTLLRLAVRSLEWPIANLVLAGVWGRFSRLDRASRETILRRWAVHPIARLRTAFQAIRRLGMFLAYADPGDDADADRPRNPLWPQMGYRPASAVPAPPDTIEPLAADRRGSAPLELDADVVVVGSGAGGGLVAARLAAAGRAVLVVEAGVYRPERTMPRLEGEAFRDLYLDRGTTSTTDLGVTILAGSSLGGGTTVNWTTSLPPPAELRAVWAAEHGLDGYDGPETDTDLERIRGELELQPPTTIPPKDAALLRGASALGWEASPTERNAGPCTDCGACGFGCRSGAKRSGLRTHLAAATRDGARFLVEAPVDEVVLRAGRAVGLRGHLLVDGERGRPFVVRAPVVVVAAGALRTSLILQRSGIGHPQMGRNLRLHPVVAVAGAFAEPIDAWLGPLQAARSMQFLAPGPAADGIGPAHGGFLIESAPPHPGLIASAFPWLGAVASREFMGRARHLAPFIALLRESGEGRVALSRGGYPRITYRLSADDRSSARRALIEMSRLARAAGAEQVIALATPPHTWRASAGDPGFDRMLHRLGRLSMAANRATLFSAHQLGSARAGLDPATHPCDPGGRVRSSVRGDLVPGLYVGDTSLFPTPSVVNPMLTAMTLAERTARAVLADG
jgi:choline dehydrogenase-like flavoprotein